MKQETRLQELFLTYNNQILVWSIGEIRGPVSSTDRKNKIPSLQQLSRSANRSFVDGNSSEGSSMAIIRGTNGDDNPLNGTSLGDTINGFGGNDHIFGLARIMHEARKMGR
jgi:hypothetical protein